MNDNQNDLLQQAIAELKNSPRVDIKGKSYNKVAVAQFQHNLRQTEEFDNLFVSEMVKEEAYYNFSIMLEAKGDETDEN